MLVTDKRGYKQQMQAAMNRLSQNIAALHTT